MSEYLHQEPGAEVRFIAGHYTIVEEQQLAYCGREVLFFLAIAVVDGTCCGTQGCRFINIPGYVLAWKARLSENGMPISIVEAVGDESEQAGLREILNRRYPHSQILFSV